jgi:hypothetical protein
LGQNGPVKIVEAAGFGLTGEVTKVGIKIVDESRDGSETWVPILAVANAEKIIGGFSGDFRHGSIGGGQTLIAPMLE